MEIVRITDGDYRHYEELLLQRDQLEKEALGYQMAYLREFGERMTEVFQEKLECIALKKAITFCQRQKNRGNPIDPAAMQEYLDTHMAAYYEQLNRMIAQHKAANSGKPISEMDVMRVKKIYRRLAKLLHPDLSPLTSGSQELAELFQEVLQAYRCNDLKRLQELEVRVQRALEDLGREHTEIVIDSLEEKIEALEKEIETILTTEPYCYKDLLEDEEAVREKKEALEKELAEYREYRAELQKLLDGYSA